MNIGYVTTYDATDVHNWSGSAYFISKALQYSGAAVHYVGNLRQETSRALRIKKIAHRVLTNKVLLHDRNTAVAGSYARQAKEALSRNACDVVFSPGTIPIAALDVEQPIVFWADATFAGMLNFYGSCTNLCKETIRDGNRLEQAALSRCTLAIYASDWAAQTALEYYDVDSSKVKVVAFGANLESCRGEAEVRGLIAGKKTAACNLLFIGVDWQRKGGDLAVQVAQLLNDGGIPTQLHLVGCTPPYQVPDFVRVHGFISKRTPEGRRRLEELFCRAHFLLQPSRAECYGVVFAEASAYGVPSLATKVGGIPSAIADGKNGRLFELSAGAEEYAACIADMLCSEEGYAQLAESSYREYAERINWRSAGQRVGQLIADSISGL